MDIDFDNIKKEILKRETEIKSLRQQIAPLLIVDEDLRVMVDKSVETEARQLVKKIKELRQQNEKDLTFSNHALELCKQHNIQHSPRRVDFTQIMDIERNTIRFGIDILKNKFLTGELNSTEFEEQSKKLKEGPERRISEIQGVVTQLDAFHNAGVNNDSE